MKKIYSLIIFALLLANSTISNGQQKTNEILTTIASEINQDSIHNYILGLQNLETRYAKADNRKEVALWIKQKFESFGYQNVVLDSFLLVIQNNQWMQYNVICKSDSIYDHDKYVLLGAHHDAITYTNPMEFTPGADDNASGVAGVLETARVLKLHGQNSKVPFHFATWAAEELGLHGSKHYVEQHLAMNDLPVFYFNLDMIANSTNGNRKVNYNVTGGLNHLLNIASEHSEVIPVPNTIGGGSDHMPFITENVPIIYFIENNFSEYYHSDLDLLENLELDYAAEVIKGTATAFYYGANANPAVEIEQDVNGGAGDNFIVTWQAQENAIGYTMDIFLEDSLIQTLQTEDDSIYVSGMPENQNICFELYSLNSDSIGGLRTRTCFDLSAIPDPLSISANMNLNDIRINWSLNLPLDANTVIIERKLHNEEEYEIYDEITASQGKFEEFSHETGIWEYRFTLKDQDGLTSEPVSTIVYATEVKNDVMIVSGQLGGYNNPTHPEVLSFYESILPMKDHFMYAAASQAKYMPIMANMEVVIWNAFSSNFSRFYENIELIQTYLENGGKVLLFGNNPQKHIDPSHPEGLPYAQNSWVYSLGISSILENNGAKLMQMQYSPEIHVNTNPDKLPASFNGALPNIDALVTNENASVILTYQSLSNESPINDFDNEPIAIKYDDGNSKFIICGVPLYYFDENESKILLKKLLEDEMMVGETELEIVDHRIEIYPNPTERIVNIKNTSNEILIGEFQLTDLSGRLLDQFNLNIGPGNTKQINIDVIPGIYFLRNDQLLQNEKIIVK
jgi:hypothetical protein